MPTLRPDHLDAPVGAGDWSAWLGERMQAVGLPANSDLARAAGIPDSAVSRWRTAGTIPSVTQLRRLVEPLQASMLELLVAAGHLTPTEAALRDVVAPTREPRSTRAAIDADADLPDDLRQLLLLQYEAMLAMARARRG